MNFRYMRRRIPRCCSIKNALILSLFATFILFLHLSQDAQAKPVAVPLRSDDKELPAAPMEQERDRSFQENERRPKSREREDVQKVPVDDANVFNRIGESMNNPQPPQPPLQQQRRNYNKEKRSIDGEPYPKLNSAGAFIPMRRIVHIDMKGAPYRASVYPQVFDLLKRMGATGVVLEWEDMFPYEGALKDAVNGNAYTMEEVDSILSAAHGAQLQIVPLVQTFAHLEWLLKLKEFAHLRDDPANPQVMCIGKEYGWHLIKDMINQVGKVHGKYGLPFFHIGADEIFNMGTCNETAALITKHSFKERLILYHIARTAEHVKNTFKDTVPLAWHDMFAHANPTDVTYYNLPSLVEPVLWSYAEDLDQYLQPYNWEALSVFPRVWGSSAWKGADGPMRFHSNPIHYIRNHRSWTKQFTANYHTFEYMQGLIMTGWSRYDHLAVLAETLPVGIPALAMSMETIMTGRPLEVYPKTAELLKCTLPTESAEFVYGCEFVGRKVYERVNDFVSQKRQMRKYFDEDFELNGWMSSHADKYSVSSSMYINKILPFVEYYQQPLDRLYKDLKQEMSKIFFDEDVTEFLETYVDEYILLLRTKLATARRILTTRHFPKRPYVKVKTDL